MSNASERGSYDLEAEHWTQTRCFGIMYGPPGRRVYHCETDERHSVPPSEVIRAGLYYIIKVATEKGIVEWWAHNGGKYDITLLLPVIVEMGIKCDGILAGGRLIVLTLHVGKLRIKLCDSYAVVSSALKKCADAFNLPSKKLFTDEDYTRVHRWGKQKLIEGCRADCALVLELLEEAEKFLIQYGGSLKLTAASSALSVMKANSEMVDISKSDYVNEWCRGAYYGGRVEIFRHKPDRAIAYWDVNSSYPWSLSGKMPGHPFKFKLGHLDLESSRAEMAIVEATVSVPECYVPPLPFRTEEGGLYFPTGTFRGKWTAEELRFAMECGTRIVRVHAYQAFNVVSPFAKFVTEIYAEKAGSLGAKQQMCKLLLNSSYGKLGERPEKSTLKIMSELEGVNLIAQMRPNVRPLGANGDTRFFAVDAKYWSKHTHYAQAATVTSRSRILLCRHFMNAEYLCYGDTDSIHASFESQSQFVTGSDLGLLKLEASAMKARYYAPKIYRLDFSDKDPVFHAKGFPLGKKGKQQKKFETLVSGKAIEAGRMRLVKQLLRKLKPERVEELKEWTGESTKRALTGERDGNTRPWTVTEIQAGKHVKQPSPHGRVR